MWGVASREGVQWSHFPYLGSTMPLTIKSFDFSPFEIKPKILFRFFFFFQSKAVADIGPSWKWSNIKWTWEKQGILVIVPGAVLALFRQTHWLSCMRAGGSRWFLRAKCLISPRSWVKRIYKGGERKRTGFVRWWLSSTLNCFLEEGVSQRQQVSLWGHLPFSLMPFLSYPNYGLLLEEP